jgi:hypothetical protein
MHLWNAMPNHGPFLEFSIEDQSQYNGMYTPKLKVVDGKVKIPDEGYGWGVTIREDWLRRAEYQLSEV